MRNDDKKNTTNCQQQQEKEGKQFPNQEAAEFQKGLFQEGIESMVVASVKKVATADGKTNRKRSWTDDAPPVQEQAVKKPIKQIRRKTII